MRGVAALVFLAVALCAQPDVKNAKLESRAVTGSLESTFRQTVAAQSSPAWIAYAVPQIAGQHTMCGWNQTKVYLEGAPQFYVFFRVSNGAVEKIRTYSMDCEIDAGDIPLYWLTGVKPAESITLLETFLKAGHREVLSAIALHRDSAADAVLDRMVAPEQPEAMRRQAAFWLGTARGRHGFEIMARLLKEDPSASLREHTLSALSQSKEPEAQSLLLRIAKEDPSPRVRGQALFWVAKRSPREIAEPAIRSVLERDADSQVQAKAVFALTQMPDNAGTPVLIEIARNTKSEALRKQALNWLGRSTDPRARKFFEGLLSPR